MLASLNPYTATVWAMGVAGLLLVIQLLIADLAGLRAGHTPGIPSERGHGDLLFRLERAHANTNESIAAYVLLLLFAMLLGAEASWVNALAWAWVSARVGHMACYYLDIRVLRSVMFGISLVVLAAIFAVGASTRF